MSKTDHAIKPVTVNFDEGIAWVTLNRPEKRNAMNPALNSGMLNVLNELELDDRCGVVVLTGVGDSFTAGKDLKEYFRETDGLPPIAMPASSARRRSGCGASSCIWRSRGSRW